MRVYTIIVIKLIEYRTFLKQKLNNDLIKIIYQIHYFFIQLNISNSKLNI